VPKIGTLKLVSLTFSCDTQFCVAFTHCPPPAAVDWELQDLGPGQQSGWAISAVDGARSGAYRAVMVTLRKDVPNFVTMWWKGVLKGDPCALLLPRYYVWPWAASALDPRAVYLAPQ
jgi:hypothetical protein